LIRADRVLVGSLTSHNLADWLRQLRDAQAQAPLLPNGWRSGGDCCGDLKLAPELAPDAAGEGGIVRYHRVSRAAKIRRRRA
jgi:hypothetical protein